ncbi:capsid protein [Capybara virus 5_cap1_460]|nr:capsid protein [Capybara virus 5_cap1_460]
MAFRRRRRFRRRRFGRRVSRRVVRNARRGLRRIVRRTALRLSEPKTLVNFEGNLNSMLEANANGRIVYIASPPQGLVQGTQNDQIIGNRVWLTGILLRGAISMDSVTPTANGCLVDVWCIWSKDQGSGLQASFVPYTGLTTINTNPAQTAPDINVRLWDDPNVPDMFIGNGMATPFDRTSVTVIKHRKYFINPGADTIAAEASIPTEIKMYVPIQKMMQIEDPGQQGFTTGARRFKYGSYYFVIRVTASYNGAVTDTVCNMSYRLQTFYRDP